ncbi:MAG TPA: DUF2938 domain-containing protein [Bacteroidales bacterium]|nr:DUF2938 domain-containing protein [Bacteroidales bacterium]
MNYRHFLAAVCIGFGATLFTDLWNLFLKRSFNIRSLDFCLLGRWILYMPHGKFIHDNIKMAQPKSYECAIGWLAHYSIGISLTVFFVLFVILNWIRLTIFSALLYGICTVVFPLFVLQPSLGLGLASSKTPIPAQARFKSLMTHFFFGLGIWLFASVAKYFFKLY